MFISQEQCQLCIRRAEMIDMVVGDDQLIGTMNDISFRSIDRPLIQSMFTRHGEIQVGQSRVTENLRVIGLIVYCNHIHP